MSAPLSISRRLDANPLNDHHTTNRHLRSAMSDHKNQRTRLLACRARAVEQRLLFSLSFPPKVTHCDAT